MTGGAGIPQPSLAIATRAGKVELHGASHLVDTAGAIALGANGGGAADGARAVTRLANLLTRGIETHLSATDGLPEIDVQAVLEIGTLFRAAGSSLFASITEEL